MLYGLEVLNYNCFLHSISMDGRLLGRKQVSAFSNQSIPSPVCCELVSTAALKNP